jgi:hypothetical protein
MSKEPPTMSDGGLCDLPVVWQREIVALRTVVALELGWDRLRKIKAEARRVYEEDREEE